MSYFLSYCKEQRQWHIEEEKEYWERNYRIYIDNMFAKGSYVPIKKFETYEDYTKWFKIHLTYLRKEGYFHPDELYL